MIYIYMTFIYQYQNALQGFKLNNIPHLIFYWYIQSTKSGRLVHIYIL